MKIPIVCRYFLQEPVLKYPQYSSLTIQGQFSHPLLHPSRTVLPAQGWIQWRCNNVQIRSTNLYFKLSNWRCFHHIIYYKVWLTTLCSNWLVQIYPKISRIEVTAARLRWRGFSEEIWRKEVLRDVSENFEERVNAAMIWWRLDDMKWDNCDKSQIMKS
jgi:hypothetical protein